MMINSEKFMTIGEMATALAAVDATYSAAYLARQIRNMVTRRVLEPNHYHGEGRTAAAMFSEADLCRARLLGVLTRMGVPLETLISARHCMNNVDGRALSERGVHAYVPGVPVVIDRLKQGERWFFVGHVAHGRNFIDAEPGAVVLGLFTPNPDFSNSLTQSQAGIGIVLDCMMLLGPLVMNTEEYSRAYDLSCGVQPSEAQD